jgi:DNA-binding NarL/FixJ family response regulator
MTVRLTGYQGLSGPPAVRLYSAAARAAGVQPEIQRIATLTPRERAILRLLAEGRSNEQIARRLDMSPSNVRNRVSDLLSKLGVGSRTEAALLGQRLGLERIHHNRGVE